MKYEVDKTGEFGQYILTGSVTDDIFSLKDISIKRDEQKARKLMRSYARNVSIAATDTIGARVYKYRDSKRREADAVIQFNDGSWALIEVKPGGEGDIKQAEQKVMM